MKFKCKQHDKSVQDMNDISTNEFNEKFALKIKVVHLHL